MRRWRVVAAVVVLFAMTGCSGEPPRGDVEGTITLHGKPLAGVQVVFSPAIGDSSGARAVGTTDEHGRFQLHGDRGEPGAPIGTHAVVVTDPRSLRMPGGGGDKNVRPPASRVPVQYTSFANTPLRAEVRAGSQTVNLELSGTAK